VPRAPEEDEKVPETGDASGAGMEMREHRHEDKRRDRGEGERHEEPLTLLEVRGKGLRERVGVEAQSRHGFFEPSRPAARRRLLGPLNLEKV
jgi:hypothetical protein